MSRKQTIILQPPYIASKKKFRGTSGTTTQEDKMVAKKSFQRAMVVLFGLQRSNEIFKLVRAYSPYCCLIDTILTITGLIHFATSIFYRCTRRNSNLICNFHTSSNCSSSSRISCNSRTYYNNLTSNTSTSSSSITNNLSNRICKSHFRTRMVHSSNNNNNNYHHSNRILRTFIPNSIIKLSNQVLRYITCPHTNK